MLAVTSNIASRHRPLEGPIHVIGHEALERPAAAMLRSYDVRSVVWGRVINVMNEVYSAVSKQSPGERRTRTQG